MHDLQGALIAQKTPFSMIMLYTITLVVVVALVWAHFARVERLPVATGKSPPAASSSFKARKAAFSKS